MCPTQEIVQHDPADWPQILIMEDEPNVAKGLRMILSEEGYAVDLALTGQGALDYCRQKTVDLLVADLRLPDIDGMEVIRQVKSRRPETGVVVITGYATVASAVEAMRTGAYEYLPKPFTDDEFKSAVEGALKEKAPLPDHDGIEKTDPEQRKLIQKREVIRALTRVSQDEAFWNDLLENGSAALKGYNLSSRAKAAIISGDLNWIQQNVGRLTGRQLEWIRARLEMERW